MDKHRAFELFVRDILREVHAEFKRIKDLNCSSRIKLLLLYKLTYANIPAGLRKEFGISADSAARILKKYGYKYDALTQTWRAPLDELEEKIEQAIAEYLLEVG